MEFWGQPKGHKDLLVGKEMVVHNLVEERIFTVAAKDIDEFLVCLEYDNIVHRKEKVQELLHMRLQSYNLQAIYTESTALHKR